MTNKGENKMEEKFFKVYINDVYKGTVPTELRHKYIDFLKEHQNLIVKKTDEIEFKLVLK